MDHLRHQKYKNKELRNNTLELENNFKPINMIMIWINLKKTELTKKRRFTKNTWHDWYDWLTNYIPEPKKSPWVGLKTKT